MIAGERMGEKMNGMLCRVDPASDSRQNSELGKRLLVLVPISSRSLTNERIRSVLSNIRWNNLPGNASKWTKILKARRDRDSL